MKCALCGKEITHHGHNGEPCTEGRVCDECNIAKVLPARILLMNKNS